MVTIIQALNQLGNENHCSDYIKWEIYIKLNYILSKAKEGSW